MEANKTVSIKSTAKQAKHRLISGYWNDIRQKREDYFNKINYIDREKLQKTYSNRIERKLKEENSADPDALLYKKVCKLQAQDTFVLNPISQLINHDEYDKLTDSEKQIYLMRLTKKYNQLLERYNEEQKESMLNYAGK